MSMSGGGATALESAHMLRVKEGVCIACLLRCAAGLLPYQWVQVGHDGTDATFWGMLEAHHTKSGNVRRGHFMTVGLCPWHHRGNQAMPPSGWTHSLLRDRYGVSLADGSGIYFRQAYGTDDDLLEVQAAYLDGELGPTPWPTPWSDAINATNERGEQA